MLKRPSVESLNYTEPLVSELPLFPLNVVLFPHMPLPIHIFEQRYMDMVNRCIEDNTPFGIVLITRGSERDPVTETRRIGCTARISHVERLADGRMNLLVVGESRFRIVGTDESRAYRTGITTPFCDESSDAAAAVPLGDEVQKLLREFLTHSLAIAGQRVETLDLPDEPEQLSFAAASVLPIENSGKQALLEQTDTVARLSAEREILLREVIRLRRAAAAQTAPEPITSELFATYRCLN